MSVSTSTGTASIPSTAKEMARTSNREASLTVSTPNRWAGLAWKETATGVPAKSPQEGGCANTSFALLGYPAVGRTGGTPLPDTLRSLVYPRCRKNGGTQLRYEMRSLGYPHRRNNGGHSRRDRYLDTEIARPSRFAKRNASTRASGESGAGPKRSRWYRPRKREASAEMSGRDRTAAVSVSSRVSPGGRPSRFRSRRRTSRAYGPGSGGSPNGASFPAVFRRFR